MKRLVIKITIVIFLLVSFVGVNIIISYNQYKDKHSYYSGEELLSTQYVSSLFDEEGEGKYRISFRGKSDVSGTVLMFLNYGINGKYVFDHDPIVEMTPEWKNYNIEVNLSFNKEDGNQPTLTFRGNGNGVCPNVTMLKIVKIY